jgi:excisionase family DNA binding protein
MQMNALLDRPGTIVPTESDSRLAAESSRILAKRKPEGEFRVQLEDGQVVRLPHAAHQLLSHLLTEMANGNAVTLIPVHAELTTQEAAEFLNVSRPFVVKLLEEGHIPHHKVGTHRRIRFSDLRAFKEASDASRRDALDRLADQARDLGVE